MIAGSHAASCISLIAAEARRLLRILMALEESQHSKVYRLRGIPLYLDRQGVADLLYGFLPDGSRSDITIASLALSCDFWSPNSRTATLTFSKPPTVVTAAFTAKEWRLPVRGLQEQLILDDRFNGLTPLNDVPTDQHEHEYAPKLISGAMLFTNLVTAASSCRVLPAILWAHGSLEVETNLSCGSATLCQEWLAARDSYSTVTIRLLSAASPFRRWTTLP